MDSYGSNKYTAKSSLFNTGSARTLFFFVEHLFWKISGNVFIAIWHTYSDSPTLAESVSAVSITCTYTFLKHFGRAISLLSNSCRRHSNFTFRVSSFRKQLTCHN